MEKIYLKKSEIELILNVYMEEKMTAEEIERITPFDSKTIDLIVKLEITKLHLL